MLTFDQILELAKRKPAIPYTVKAWGKEIFVRDPSSADADEWRLYCFQNKGKQVPVAAKMAQIMLCDAEGNRIVPDGEEALAALADMPAAGLDELFGFCQGLMDSPSDDDIEEERKN